MGYKSLIAWWLGGVDQTVETPPQATGAGTGKTACISVSRERTVTILRERTINIIRDCRR